jgi:hypothetical protein
LDRVLDLSAFGVGAEVPASDTTESERTGAATSLNVGRFGAGAIEDRYLADPESRALLVEEGLGLAPDVVAVAVELRGLLSAAGGSVDLLAEDIGVAGVSAGLFDHVHQDPSHRWRRPWARGARGGKGQI